MLLAIEGIAGAGKSTVRDRVLAAAADENIAVAHIGQFSWLSLDATRTIIELRAGRPAPDLRDATRAVRLDLELHARHNLIPALSRGSVIADRLILSTACLLALLYQEAVDDFVQQLADATPACPQLTVLLTTPPSVCESRLGHRTTARRFGEDPATATQLADLYQRAATIWTQTTRLPVLRYPCTIEHDVDRVATDCLDYLRQAPQIVAGT